MSSVSWASYQYFGLSERDCTKNENGYDWITRSPNIGPWPVGQPGNENVNWLFYQQIE